MIIAARAAGVQCFDTVYTDLKDMDGFRKGFVPQAESQVKTRLALEKIVELEKIEPTAEEIAAEYDKLAKNYSMEPTSSGTSFRRRRSPRTSRWARRSTLCATAPS